MKEQAAERARQLLVASETKKNEPLSTQAATELETLLRGQLATAQVDAWQELPKVKRSANRCEGTREKNSPMRVNPKLQAVRAWR